MSEEESKGSWVEKLPWWAVPAFLLGVPLLLAIGAKLAPEQVYDNLIWKYYWGPIKADAAEGTSTLLHNGVAAHAGYNVVNTLTWAVLLGACILGIKQILDAAKTKMDTMLVVGATFWVIAGSITHVLQDTNLIGKPFEYLYITPPIYLLYGLGGVASFVVGVYLKGVAQKAELHIALQKLWLIMAIPVFLWLFLWLEGSSYIARVLHPFWLLGFTVATFYIIRARFEDKGQFDPKEFVLLNSLPWIGMSIVYCVSFIQNPWDDRVIGDNAVPSALWSAPALALGAVLVTYVVARWFANRGKTGAMPYLLGINLLVVFSQTLDGFATSLGLDVAGYQEKHVLSAWVIDSFHDLSANIGFAFGEKYPTFLAFAPLKWVLALLVVYALDKEQSKSQALDGPKSLMQNESMLNLAKFAIIMVGLGPGIRDFVRLAMGV